MHLSGAFVSEPVAGRAWLVGTGPQTTHVAVRMGAVELGTLAVRHDAPGAPFRAVGAVGAWLAVGLGDHAYLLHPASAVTREVRLDFYFGSFYPLADNLLVCSASEVVCLNEAGLEVWRAGGLGVDGVLVHGHDHATVRGEADVDPPGNWQPFVLDHGTGIRLS